MKSLEKRIILPEKIEAEQLKSGEIRESLGKSLGILNASLVSFEVELITPECALFSL